MGRPKTAAITLAVLSSVLVVMVAESYARVPERIAAHVPVGGLSDGWTPGPAYAASVLLGDALMEVVCAGSTHVARYLPDHRINAPYRG